MWQIMFFQERSYCSFFERIGEDAFRQRHIDNGGYGMDKGVKTRLKKESRNGVKSTRRIG